MSLNTQDTHDAYETQDAHDHHEVTSGTWGGVIDQVLLGEPFEDIFVTCSFCTDSIPLTDYMYHIRNQHFEHYVVWMAILDPLYFESAETETYEDLVALCDTMGNVETGIQDINAVTQISTINEQDRCSICLESYDVNDATLIRKITKCSHSFHDNCISQWLLKKKTCPMCMQFVE